MLGRKIDLCYAFTAAQPQISWPALFCKKVKKTKLIIDWDDLWGGGFGLYHHPLINKIFYWHERGFLSYANAITYVSQKILDEINHASEKTPKLSEILKFKLINGADSSAVERLEKVECKKVILVPNKITLVSMGNTYTEGLGIMLRALKRVKDRGIEFQLLLIGSAEIPRKLNNEFKEIKDRVAFKGKVPHEEIKFYLGAADVLLLPMDDDPVEHARFPMRFGDYLLAGRPIISNAVGEIRKFIEDYQVGIVTSIKNEIEFSESVINLIADPVLAETMGKRAMELACNEMAHKNQCKIIKEIIKEVGSEKS
ncbi:glycosyltransferase family 4 protein [Polynucleobacter paneuropaeus]|nr:glycosyltransferase family 4 protein [Polynucleobacter paneuropaeus]QWD09505.1 glycosyltransferase family 4 protein [Polynucleobacter paneuropaeus]